MKREAQAQIVHSVVFAAQNRVELRREERRFELGPQELLLETRYSCISAGTELAKLTGLQTVQYPLCLGNRAIGRVLETGPEVRHLRPGDLVFTHTAHTSHTQAAGLAVRLPEALDRPAAATLGMGMVAIVGVQTAAPELGDTAVVTGAGLVGQFAAQLLECAGVRTILVDRSPGRLAIAEQCGVSHIVAADSDTRERVLALTGGTGADVVLECSGIPAVAEQAAGLAATSGKLVLVGSPRGAHQADFAGFLNRFHLWREHGNLTLQGAHEWKTPLYPTGYTKHCQQRNFEILTGLAVGGKLRIDPLLSKLFRPAEAATAYAELQHRPERVLGAVFDWTDGGGEREW